jgi:hypothetical protein
MRRAVILLVLLFAAVAAYEVFAGNWLSFR